ncbi:MAG: hypothetical protein ACI4JM_09640 [Oscillospiraceae bacterium]
MLFISNTLLLRLYETFGKRGKLRKTINFLRVIAVCILSVMIILPYILLGFEKNKMLYPVKKWLFDYGVFKVEFMPDKLPEICDDYYFRQKGSSIAQDYHAGEYLVFRTDYNTLSEYEKYFQSIDDFEIIDKNDKRYVCDVYEDDNYGNPIDMHNPIIYTDGWKYCFIDYKSGFVIFKI